MSEEKYNGTYTTTGGAIISTSGSTAGQITWPTTGVHPHIYQGKTGKNTEIIDSIIIGKMSQHGIPISEFDKIRPVIYTNMFEIVMNGSIYTSYPDLAFSECVKFLPTYKFKNDMNQLLDSENA